VLGLRFQEACRGRERATPPLRPEKMPLEEAQRFPRALGAAIGIGDEKNAGGAARASNGRDETLATSCRR